MVALQTAKVYLREMALPFCQHLKESVRTFSFEVRQQYQALSSFAVNSLRALATG